MHERIQTTDSGVAIRAVELGKCYHMYDRRRDRLKQALSLTRRKYFREFWALRDVSFEVPPGRTVGILGRNGSGKSTLLQLVTGTLTPTTGSVEVNGRVSALLELGTGFVPDFTGRENVYVYGTIMGLSRREIEERFDRIAAFADIGEFIDQPVKVYSSGMYVRLAFSAAINVDPDVLIIDEALSVGDARFQHRCMARIREFRERGVSILFVSHDTEAVKRLCDEAIILDRGRAVNRGPSLHMANWYTALVSNDFDVARTLREEAASLEDRPPDQPPAETPPTKDAESEAPAAGSAAEADEEAFRYFRHGDGSAEILSTEVLNEAGKSVSTVQLGEQVRLRIRARFHRDLPSHGMGFYIRDRLGTDLVGINTFQQGCSVPPVKSGDVVEYEVGLPCDLRPGHYSISPSIAYEQDAQVWLDWIENLLVFRVTDPQAGRTVFGVYLPRGISLKARVLGDSSADRRS